MRAQATIWGRLQAALGDGQRRKPWRPLDAEALRGMGMSLRKAKYILDFARRVQSGEFDLEAVRRMDDGQAIAALTSLRGVGVWTAEMILLFCLQRPDVLSYDDLAIRRGLRMLYRHKALDRERFERYRRRYSPVAAWPASTSGGRLRRDEGLTDPAAQARVTETASPRATLKSTDPPRRAREKNRFRALIARKRFSRLWGYTCSSQRANSFSPPWKTLRSIHSSSP